MPDMRSSTRQYTPRNASSRNPRSRTREEEEYYGDDGGGGYRDVAPRNEASQYHRSAAKYPNIRNREEEDYYGNDGYREAAPRNASSHLRTGARGRNTEESDYYGGGGDGYREETQYGRPPRPSAPQLRQPPPAATGGSSRRMNNTAERSYERSARRPVNPKTPSSRAIKIPPQPASTVESIDVFFAEISTINDLLKRLKENVEIIVQLQESLVSMEGYGDGGEQVQMDRLASECKLIMESVKTRTKAIELENARLPPSHPSLIMRATQHGQVKQNFLDFLRMYNETEREFSMRVKEQRERSIRSMNPDFTDDEIKDALNYQMEGDFQMMMMDQSGRYEGASSALAEAQSRQNEMQKIEETILQLGEMLIEMSTLVEAQGQVITTIEQHAETTEQYTEQANLELDTAIVTAKKVRGRKWQLLCCCFLLFAIAGVLLYFFVLKDLIAGKNATSAKPRTTIRSTTPSTASDAIPDSAGTSASEPIPNSFV